MNVIYRMCKYVYISAIPITTRMSVLTFFVTQVECKIVEFQWKYGIIFSPDLTLYCIVVLPVYASYAIHFSARLTVAQKITAWI